MKLVFFIFLFFTSFAIKAQICKCENELKFVIDYYEENLPGFGDNVNKDNIHFYNEFKNNLFGYSQKSCDDENDCFKILLTYVEFFNDNHSSIYQNRNEGIDESKPEEIEKFMASQKFKKREFFENFDLRNNASLNEIENTFQSNDLVYTVSIIKSKNNFRDYIGIITESKTPLWTKGQVKFELKKVGDNLFDMCLYMRNHSVQYYKNVKLKDGILNDKWFNINLTERITYNITTPLELIFKELSSETNYIYIPTFGGNHFAKLAEFYKKHDSLIQAKPNLIIDVRNNGGGSDACVNPLLKYIYTNPFYGDKVEIYSTKENIRKNLAWYETVKKDTINFSKEYLEFTAKEIKKMQSVKNKTFVSRSKGGKVQLDDILKYPQKVAIIQNKNSASSCETLLFWGLESKKTILVGENSGGYVGYGEIGEISTPNFNFELGCTMTRYHKQRKYEVVGISPNFYLSNEKDWVEQTIELLEKK